jgi:tRNA nucleotidyltransferase (CCA-adding enzyme)
VKIDIKDEVNIIIKLIEENGFEAYVVGGCVRDVLLNKTPKDWDVTTSAKPNEIIRIFEKFKVIPTGLKHGTITVVVKKYAIEITTYRIDGEYKDNRRPENVFFTNKLREDLSRRDFTINAMAYNDKIGLIDYFGGKDDLDNNIIRCVGDSDKRFSEDALRMMRAIRFSAQLNFNLDKNILKSIFDLVDNLKMISMERIRDEFLKTLDSDNPKKIKLFFDTKIIKFINANMILEYDYIIFEKVLEPLYYLRDIKSKIYVKLTLFFLGFEKDNYRISLKILNKILKSLRLDNQTIRNTEILFRETQNELLDNKKSIKLFLNRIGKENFENLLLIKKAIIFTKCKLLINSETIEIFDRVNLIYNNININKECFSINELDISGNDLIEMGFKQNKNIGKILKDILDFIIDNPDKNNKNILKDYILKNYTI